MNTARAETPSLRVLVASRPGLRVLAPGAALRGRDIGASTIFASRRRELAGKSVLIGARSQFVAARALIELDGLAARLVICPPDFSPGRLASVISQAEIDAIVSDSADKDFGAEREIYLPEFALASAWVFCENKNRTHCFREGLAMPRNKVQFQKGLSESAFNKAYGNEEQCHAALVEWRWPNGFECPDCAGNAHCVVTRGMRKLFQCNACRKQTSVRAGTVFAASKLALRLWFAAMYHLTQSKQGISSLELSRRLGITQNAAWKMKHKLAQVMLERNATKRLKGKVQMDDAYLGGERSGPPGRGAVGKTPFVAAVETTDDGKPHRIILRRVGAFSKAALRKLASTALESGAEVISDGLKCFAAVTEAGCKHTAIVTGSGPQAAKTPAFKWVNTALGNIKAALVGTYRAVREKHVPRYLAEFEYRFNRRYDLGEMIPRLAFVAIRSLPMPYRLLKLADSQA